MDPMSVSVLSGDLNTSKGHQDIPGLEWLIFICFVYSSCFFACLVLVCSQCFSSLLALLIVSLHQLTNVILRMDNCLFICLPHSHFFFATSLILLLASSFFHMFFPYFITCYIRLTSLIVSLPTLNQSRWSRKKSKSVFDFLTYSRETGFSFSYAEVECLDRANEPSKKIERVSKLDNSLSFGAKQNALQQIFFALWFF